MEKRRDLNLKLKSSNVLHKSSKNGFYIMKSLNNGENIANVIHKIHNKTNLLGPFSSILSFTLLHDGLNDSHELGNSLIRIFVPMEIF